MITLFLLNLSLAVAQQPITSQWCRHSLFLLTMQVLHWRETLKLAAEIEVVAELLYCSSTEVQAISRQK